MKLWNYLHENYCEQKYNSVYILINFIFYRPNHTNKGKQQRDRRKLREKRRSTGVVQLYSTEVYNF